MKQDMIVILDLGSHENTVVARAIRALGVYSEIYPHDITAAELKALPNVKGIIINGGPNNVIDGVAIDVLPEIYEAGFPVMSAGHDKAQCEVKLAQFGNDEEAVKIHLLEIVILGDDAEDKTDELIGRAHAEIRHGDQTDLVVEFIHMAVVLVEINDVAENILDFGVDFIQ